MFLSRLNSTIRLAACGLVLIVIATAQPVIVHYDDVAYFSEGLARVTLEGKDGFIDEHGKEIVAPKYETAYPFAGDMAAVKLDGKWGYIDKTGRESIAPKFEEVREFAAGLAPVKLNGKWGFIDATGAERIPFRYEAANPFSEELAGVKAGDKWGFIDRSGKVVITPNYYHVMGFSDGLALFAPARIGYVPWGSIDWGYINRKGEVVIAPAYRHPSEFKNGRALVGRPAFFESSILWSIIDREGKPIEASSDMVYYTFASSFVKGFARINMGGSLDLLSTWPEGGTWGFMDSSGAEIIEAVFADAEDFAHGYAAVKSGFTDAAGPAAAPHKWGFVDTSGHLALPPQFEKVTNVNAAGYAFVQRAPREWMRIHVAAIQALHRGLAAAQANDHADAMKWFQQAAALGDATAMGNIGTMLLQGMGMPQNPSEGLKWLTKGAENGDTQSMFNLGLFHAHANQRADALAWFKRADAAGHPQAKAAHDQLSRQPAPAASAPAARPAAPSPATQLGNDWETLWADPATRFQKLAASYLTATEADKTRHIEFLATKITPLWMESNLENKYLPIRAFISANFALIQAMPEGEQPPARQLLYQAIHQAGLNAAKSGRSHPGVLYNWIQPKDTP